MWNNSLRRLVLCLALLFAVFSHVSADVIVTDQEWETIRKTLNESIQALETSKAELIEVRAELTQLSIALNEQTTCLIQSRNETEIYKISSLILGGLAVGLGIAFLVK